MSTLRKTFLSWVLGSLTMLFGSASTAAPILFSDLDGSEQLFNFDSLAPIASSAILSGPFDAGEFSIQSGDNRYMLQPSGGTLLGATGVAYNTRNDGIASTTASHDATLTFDNDLSLFGMLFGTSSNGSLTATVSTFDQFNNLLDEVTFTDFGNTFVGFTSTVGIRTVVIDRTDTDGRFTFIDDIRFSTIASSGDNSSEVSAPSTLAVMALGLLLLNFRRALYK